MKTSTKFFFNLLSACPKANFGSVQRAGSLLQIFMSLVHIFKFAHGPPGTHHIRLSFYHKQVNVEKIIFSREIEFKQPFGELIHNEKTDKQVCSLCCTQFVGTNRFFQYIPHSLWGKKFC